MARTYVSKYKATYDLEDGSVFEVRYSVASYEGDMTCPPWDDTSELEFFVDDVAVESRPSEISEAELDRMVRNAHCIS